MNRTIAGVIGGVLLLVVVWSSLYTVSETEQVIITQFGEPIGQPRTDPGLHVKVPFIQQVHSFEKRWLEWDGDPNQIPTRDKKYIWVDTYSRWRVVDALKFFQNVRDERGAQSRLDDIVDGETRNVIASHDLFEIVRTSNRKFAESEEISDLEGGQVTANITIGRDGITREILKKASAITHNFGIELKDVQVKRIGYVADVQQKVYERMISERRRIAERSRSEGLGKSAEIRGQKERELKGIQSEAYKKAQELMGKADASASRIYAEAYSRDPEFYQFLKTMETYRNAINQDSTFLLSTDGDFFKYLTRAKE